MTKNKHTKTAFVRTPERTSQIRGMSPWLSYSYSTSHQCSDRR